MRESFSDAASHELRTPLARLAAALDLMEQRPDAGLVSGMRRCSGVERVGR